VADAGRGGPVGDPKAWSTVNMAHADRGADRAARAGREALEWNSLRTAIRGASADLRDEAVADRVEPADVAGPADADRGGREGRAGLMAPDRKAWMPRTAQRAPARAKLAPRVAEGAVAGPAAPDAEDADAGPADRDVAVRSNRT
jgi:hypothetical protein